MNGKVTVAVIDDNSDIRGVVATLLRRDGYVVFTADDGAAGLELVWREHPDVIISDVTMPNVDGFELCRTLKADRATRLTPLILVTGNTEREYRLKGIEAGADDFLIKPVDAAELRARVRSLVRLKQYTDDLDTAESVILSLGATVEARDCSTSGHCERMAAYAAAFGAHLGLSQEEVAALHRGGYLHDVGKVGVPDAVLLKPGRLTSEEFAVMKRHTVVGEAVCGDFRSLRLVKPIIRHHHERLDGSGYPDGLSGDEIPLLAQVVGIVDVYDALTTDRPYRQRQPADTALAALQREAAVGWRNAQLVDAFIAMSRTGGLEAMGARIRSLGPGKGLP